MLGYFEVIMTIICVYYYIGASPALARERRRRSRWNGEPPFLKKTITTQHNESRSASIIEYIILKGIHI